MLKLMLLTTDETMIRNAQDAGVDRIFLDLEYINKSERQRGRSTVISTNTVADVPRVRKMVDRAELLVRVNALYPGSEEEIDSVITNGAEIVMLPMVYDAGDVRQFVKYVGGRAKTCIMIETAQALVHLDDILETPGVDELFIGLNDLHISMGLTFMFELLSGGIVEYMADKINKKQIPFGFGGMGKIGEGLLPAENILAEHYRLHSGSVILSRTFRNECGDNHAEVQFREEIGKIRAEEAKWANATQKQRANNASTVRRQVMQIVRNMENKV